MYVCLYICNHENNVPSQLPPRLIPYAWEKLSTLGNRFIYKMEKINFGDSMKNIGIPQNKTYLLQLIEKIEMVIKTIKTTLGHQHLR